VRAKVRSRLSGRIVLFLVDDALRERFGGGLVQGQVPDLDLVHAGDLVDVGLQFGFALEVLALQALRELRLLPRQLRDLLGELPDAAVVELVLHLRKARTLVQPHHVSTRAPTTATRMHHRVRFIDRRKLFIAMPAESVPSTRRP